MPAPSPLTLAALRRQIATPSGGPARVLPLGDPRIDRHLPGGGLPIGQLHEIAAEGMQAETAAIAAGFAATLAAALVRHGQDGRVLLWIAPCCDLYAPGLLPYGIDPNHLIIVHTENDSQTLQTMETALRSGAANTVLGEVRGLTSLAARRLQLACLQQNTTSLLLRRRPKGPAALAAVTRWAIGQVPSGWERKQGRGALPPGPPLGSGDPSGGPGGKAPRPCFLSPPRWNLALTHARGGRQGEWVVEPGDEANIMRVVTVLGDDQVAPRARAVG